MDTAETGPAATDAPAAAPGVIRVEKLSEDGGLIKEVLREGTGPCPNPFEEVTGA